MPETLHLSIVVPAYKEEKRIHKILDAILEFEKTVDYKIEVVVVVDGSPDHTADAALEYKIKIPNLKVIDRKENKGKGYTVKEGVMAASGDFILFADADNSTPIEQVEKLLKYAKEYQVVIGSRYIEGGKLAYAQPFARKMGGRILNLLIQLIAIPGIKDTQCGFKLFEREAAKEIFKRQTFDRWSFDIELLGIARKLKYEIKEVGITWYNDPHSLVNPIKDGIQMIKDSMKVRKNMLAGKYK